MRKLVNKKAIATEYLPWILIAISILVILMFSIFVLKEKGIGVIDKLKDLLRFR